MGGSNFKVICAAILLMCTAHASDEVNKIATGSSLFGRELFKQFESQSNVVVSPTSAYLALAMARLGAKGQTRKEISKGLGLLENEEIEKGFSDLLTELTSVKDARVVVANRIYIEDKSSLNSEFNAGSQKILKATAEKIDFASPTAAEVINNWIRNATRNRITEIVSKGTLNDGGETKLMLMNVLYFRSPWQYKFYSPSEPRPFYVEGTKSVDAQFMSQEDYFGYSDLKDLDAELVEIPYKDKDFKFVVILPKKKVSLQELEKKIAVLNFLDLFANVKQQDLTMHLPKFQIEVTASLNDPLEKMGFSNMFTSSADFSGLTSSNLKVSKVLQKTYFEINENGTEAAAVTAIRAVAVSAKLEEQIIMCDHPFLFYLMHKRNLVLFAGKFSDPRIERVNI